MATHSSVLAWRVPGIGEPGGLPSMGPHRVKTRLKRLSSSSIHWSNHPSFQWSIHPPTHPLIHPSSTHLPIHSLPIHLPTHLPIHPSIHISTTHSPINHSPNHPLIHLFIHLSAYPPTHPYIHPSIHPSIHHPWSQCFLSTYSILDPMSASGTDREFQEIQSGYHQAQTFCSGRCTFAIILMSRFAPPCSFL